MIRKIALVLTALLAGACSSRTDWRPTEGQRLLPGFAETRPLEDIALTEHEVDRWEALDKCLEILSRGDPALANARPPLGVEIRGCARYPRDFELAEGEQPWCEIAYLRGDSWGREQQLLYCQGIDHPDRYVETRSERGGGGNR